MSDQSTHARPMISPATASLDWNAALREELDRAIVRGGGRWSKALTAVAWIHLVTFLACQFLHDPLVERDVRHLVLWVVELIVVVITMRRSPAWGGSGRRPRST